MLAPQERVVIISSRARQREVIEALYRLQSLHLIEFHEGRDAHGLKFGRPLPEGSAASERLVRLRALLRVLGLEGRAAAQPVAVTDIERRLDRALADLETNVQAAVDARDRIRAELKELDEREARLRPLARFPVALEDYRGYESLRVFVGSTSEPVKVQDLGKAGYESLVFLEKDMVAVFAPLDRADAVQEALLAKGYREMEVPAGTGHPADVLATGGEQRARLQARLTEADAEVRRLAGEHGDFLLAAEEHLAIEVEKAEAPLQFGATEYAFIVEAWSPKEEVPRVAEALRAAVGDEFHIETSAPEPAHGHGHGHAEDAPAQAGGADAQTVPAEDHAHAKEEQVPPTKYRNAGFARPFEAFTTMFSMPRYGEIDPTVVLTFAFPLFYGFMIGDVGYGLIMLALGLFMFKKLRNVEMMRELGVGIAAAGVVAAVFGGVVFHDAFGIPFDAHVPDAEIAEVTHLTEVHNAETGDHLTPCQFFAHHHGETTWGCILSGQTHLAAGHPPLSKIGDVSTLLIISVLAALAHLTVGLVFGMLNERKHAPKHAMAKAGWLLLLLAFTYQIFSIARYNKLLGVPLWFPAGHVVGYPDGASATGSLGLSALSLGSIAVAGMDLSFLFLGLTLLGLVLLLVGEGGIALLEIPSLLANILSYTRLAGVAVAKAAMAAAFNGLFLVGMVLDPHAGILLIVIGGLLVILTQTVVLVLGILSSGIQAIRLNYVEFFTKFYKGGGVPFRPFGRPRRFSADPNVPTP